jgi:hypothetical protein
MQTFWFKIHEWIYNFNTLYPWFPNICSLIPAYGVMIFGPVEYDICNAFTNFVVGWEEVDVRVGIFSFECFQYSNYIWDRS